MDTVAQCGSNILGLAGEFERVGGKRWGQDSFMISPLSDTYKENQYSLSEFRRYLVVLSLVKDKHFQEQDYIETQKTFLCSPMELYCSQMFLQVGSRELSSSLFCCAIEGTQKGGEEREVYCSRILSNNHQAAELHESFTNNLTVLTLCKSGINIV